MPLLTIFQQYLIHQSEPFIWGIHHMKGFFHLLFAYAMPEAVGAEQKRVAVFNRYDITVARLAPFIAHAEREIEQVAVHAVGLMPGVFHLLHQTVIGRHVIEPATAKEIQAAVARVRPVRRDNRGQ